MGILRIDLRGSFISPTVEKNGADLAELAKPCAFSAQQLGHIRAVREAIAWLKFHALPHAIALDAALHAKGHEPDDGFEKKDLRWISMHGEKATDAVPTMEGLMRDVGGLLDLAFPPGWVFALFAASVGPDGAFTYLSNADRDEMAKAIREWLEKIDAGDVGTTGEAV